MLEFLQMADVNFAKKFYLDGEGMKKRKMRGALGVMLSCAIALGTSGCNKKEQTAGSGKGADYPEKVTVFAWRSSSLNNEMIDYNDVKSFKMIEELTGCKVEWNLPPSSGVEEKFNLMIASGNLTDVIIGNWKENGVEKYINDKVIISLDEMKNQMPNFMKFTRENPDIAKDYVTSDGKIGYIPYVRADKELNVFYGPLIRKDWLDKLGLGIPTNSQQLYEVLKAFKTQDPNGNGKADELPMTGLGSDNICHLLSMFDTAKGFYVDNGKVKYGFMEPEFEEGMEYIAKMYSEGLIDPDYIFQDRAKQDGKITNNRAGFMYSFQPTTISNTMAQKDPNFKLVGINHFNNKEGVRTTDLPQYIMSVIGTSAAVTTKCKNSAGVVKWLDTFYSEAGINAMNFGKEGEDYTEKDGKKVFTDAVLNSKKYSVSEMFGRTFGAFNSYFPTVQKWDSYSQSLSSYGKEAIETWSKDVDTSHILPELSFTDEEKEKVTNIMSSVTTYADERIDKMILGQEAVSKIPEARKKIEEMKIKDVLKIYQTTYERYLNTDIDF